MVIVLYEDQRGPRGDFGLHDLVCQLVIDQCQFDVTRFELRRTRLIGSPQNGAGNVHRECKLRLHKLARQFHRVFAVYDEDQAHVLAKVPAASCRKLLREGLSKDCQPQASLEVITIRNNVESLIKVIEGFQPPFINRGTTLERAKTKVITSRDSIFSQCADQPPETRAALFQQLPDLARLVRKISEVLKQLP